MLKATRENLPLLTVTILIVGLVNTTVYYKNFNLQIKYFISLSELGIIFSDNLVYGTILYSIIAVIFALVFGRIFGKSIKKELVENTGVFEKRFQVFMNWLIAIIILSITTLTIWLFVRYSYTKIVVIVILMLLLIICIFLKYTIDSEYATEYIKNHLGEIPTFIFMYLVVFFPIIETIGDIESTTKGKYKGTYIKTPTKEHTSNDSSFFIGRTEKYVFVYNKKDKSTDIIPTDDIIEFKLKSK